MIPISPQPFIIREECEKAAWQHGFRRVLGESDGWAAFGSTTAQGTLWLAAASAQGPDYPSETFRVLKEKEIRHHGEYGTRRLVLQAWDRMIEHSTFTAFDLSPT